ncbi:MAG: hypothetical protein AB1324_07205 [Candidatus Micrarchaeota archaeon]
MNRTILLAFLMLPLAFANHIYTVDVDRSGFASVTLSMEGTGAASVPLPADARNFRIVGGNYSIVNGSAVVASGTSGFTTFSFATSVFTEKTPQGWKLLFLPAEGARVMVYMPPYATVQSAFPAQKSVSSDDSRTLMEFDYARSITVFYSLETAPEPAPADNTGIFLIGAALILAGAAIIVTVLRRPQKIVVETKPAAAEGQTVQAPSAAPPEKAPSLEMTPGKREMMETFNENDVTIVNFLLSGGGKSRRNELERKTGISKSSLAMAINRLEKRKIIEIDRSSTTHFVKLADYFLKL